MGTDHEDEPFGALVQSLAPVTTKPGPLPVETKEGAAPAYPTEDVPEPDIGAPEIGSETKEKLVFKFKAKGKLYRATAYYSNEAGHELKLERWHGPGAGFQPSASALQSPLLAFLIMQHTFSGFAKTGSGLAASVGGQPADEGSESSDSAETPDSEPEAPAPEPEEAPAPESETPAKPKQKVKG